MTYLVCPFFLNELIWNGKKLLWLISYTFVKLWLWLTEYMLYCTYIHTFLWMNLHSLYIFKQISNDITKSSGIKGAFLAFFFNQKKLWFFLPSASIKNLNFKNCIKNKVQNSQTNYQLVGKFFWYLAWCYCTM